MAQTNPSQYTANMAKKQRVNRIFVDYLRNSSQATAIAPYSLRARPGAPVAMPIPWSMVTKIRPEEFNLQSVMRGVKPKIEHAWGDFFSVEQSIKRKRA